MAETNHDKLGTIYSRVANELEFATQRYGKFTSEHEGYAILLEEMDELWEAVRLKQSDPMRKRQCTKEAIQVAAMSIRFLHDVGEL